MWLLPLLMLGTSVLLAIPFGYYLAAVLDGRLRAPRFLRWCEDRVDTGPQTWKQYAVSLMVFNVVMFVFGFLVLALQPLLPLNPEGKGMLAPTTIFNTVASFMTNTNLQHYSGDQHLSYFSQIFFVVWNMFVSASVGFCALLAIIRLLRSDPHVGNYFVDMFRIVTYTFIPAAFVMGIVLMHDGIPMTLHNVAEVQTLEAGSMGTGDDGSRSRN